MARVVDLPPGAVAVIMSQWAWDAPYDLVGAVIQAPNGWDHQEARADHVQRVLWCAWDAPGEFSALFSPSEFETDLVAARFALDLMGKNTDHFDKLDVFGGPISTRWGDQ